MILSIFTYTLQLGMGCSEEKSSPTGPNYQYTSESTEVHEIQNFSTAKECGECHPTHYAQWSQSMHAYATRSPVFERMNEKAYRDSSEEVGEFCTRCHSVVGDELGEDALSSYETRSEIGQEGVTCITCHQMTASNLPIGNANVHIDEMGLVFGPFQDSAQTAHASQPSDLLQSSKLCGSCHDVFMYPGIAIEQAYTEYVDSPAADAGQRCQDCHMTPNPGVVAEKSTGPIAVVPGKTYPDRTISEHYFTGPDYALVSDWPYGSIAENEAAREASLERSLQLLQSAIEIGNIQPTINNSQLHLNVEICSLVEGHNVPTGFTSERQLWLEVIVRDRNDQIIFTSGDLDTYGDLRNHHSWDVLHGDVEEDVFLFNLQSTNEAIARGYFENGENNPNQQTEYHDAVFPFQATTIVRNSLSPLEHRIINYQTTVLGNQRPITIDLRLRYRNLPPYMMRELQLDDLTEKLHIFDIDSRSYRVQ